MNDEYRDIIETRMIHKYKRTTAQSVRDHSRVLERIDKNGIKVDYVGAYIDKLFGRHIKCAILLEYATRIANTMHLKLDRLAKRNRNALVCWYAENWEVVLPFLMEFRLNDDLWQKIHQTSPPSPLPPEEQPIDKAKQVDILDIYQLLNYHSENSLN